MERLNREEIEGVIAHEISHIRNYDIRLQTTALALSSAIVFLANLGSHAMWWGPRRDDDDREGNGVLDLVMMVLSILAIVLGPLAASLAQMALSRNREYLADASAVELTRNPQGLISALEKITNQTRQAPRFTLRIRSRIGHGRTFLIRIRQPKSGSNV